MKKFLYLCMSGVLCFVMFYGCDTPKGRLEPFRWKTLDSKMDSLSLQAEFLWIRCDSPDSIASTIDEMEQAAMMVRGNRRNEALARVHYWKGRLFRRKRDMVKMMNELNLALELTDSIKDPYTYGRTKELLYLASNSKSQDFFKFLLSQMDYYKQIGDLTQQANIAVNIFSCLNAPIEPFMTLDYLQQADSLYELLGFEQYRVKNRINVASLLYDVGEPEKAREILDSLMINPYIRRDRLSMELVLRNHFSFFGDSLSLFRGYHLVRSERKDSDNVGMDSVLNSPTLISLYESLICNYYLDRGCMDSAAYYYDLSKRNLASMPDRHIRAGIYEIYSGYLESIGEDSDALRYLKLAIELADSLEAVDQPHKKVYLENGNTLRIKEIEAQNKHRRLKLIFYLIIAGMLIVLAVIVIFFQHRRQLHKVRSVQTQLELERGQRKLLALSLSKEESNKTLDYIKDEMARMARDGKISISQIYQIERNLKLHLAGRGERESFEQTFENVNPDFIRRLKEICPSISENNIRLCSYVVIGLSNRQIADLMNIRIASVKQSRWRLRSRLGLTSDQSLEDFLRSLQD